MDYFTIQNTTGDTQAGLDALNTLLEGLLTGIEPSTQEWYETVKGFADIVAHR